MTAVPVAAFLRIDVTPALLGASAFLTTNIDDFFLLIGFFADPEFSTPDIVAGQYLGTAVLTLLCGLAAAPARVVPPAWLGLLGLVPLWLGCRALWSRRRADAGTRVPRRSFGRTTSRTLTVALVTIANGGDNVGVFVPLFAAQDASGLGVILAVFVVMTGVWCAGAGWFVVQVGRHPHRGALLRTAAEALMPFVLIALGLVILARLAR